MAMRFEGTDQYVADGELSAAVNAAVALERPLLVKGEPGTGKTELAKQVAQAMGMPLIEWHVKSTTKARQGLYEYDAVARLRDSQLGDDRVHDINNYIRKGKLWKAFAAPEAADAPFRFVMHHRPLYCLSTSTECTVNAPHLRGQVEGLYRELGVAAVMVGHIHNYQRTFPVADAHVVGTSYDNASAPMYLVNGGPGNREGNPPFKPGSIPAWGAFRTIERSFMTYDIVAADGEAASTKKVTLHAKLLRSTTGAVIDAFNLTKFV